MMRQKTQQKRKEQILNKIPIFLAKTFRIIDNPQYFQIISWTDDQLSFVVKDISRLTDEVFPRHFKHTNFASFVRQLNMYGFRKIRCDQQQGPVFHHQFFQKSNLELLLQMKRKNVGGNEQPGEGAIVPVGGRQEKLEREVEVLKSQHQELQSMMEILMEQNKSITAQNKAFANMMGQMKQKYRKKLETLMLLFLFGKKAKAQDSDFLFPPQLEHMLQAFEQMKNGSNPLIILPPKKAKRNQLRMITGQPHFYSDGEKSEIGSQMDKSDKQDIFHVLKQLKQEQKSQKSHSSGNKRKNKLQKQISFEQDKHEDLPPSPLSSIISRSGRKKQGTYAWDDYLERLNHSDYSDLQLQQQN